MTNQITNYGQSRDVNATAEELEIFALVKEISGEDLELVRHSDSYVTAMLGEWDVARFKFTDRAKWIRFPIFDSGSAKHQIGAPAEVREWSEMITDSIEHIKKYS